MKKLMKRILIIFIICAVVVGGLLVGYNVNQSSKVAQVASLNMYGMDSYWGDSIESSGTVTSDQSQIVYLTSEQKVLSVEVAEGDQVQVGDVLVKIDTSDVDLKGKELELEKAQINLKIAKTQLSRLEKLTPSLDTSGMEVVENYDHPVLYTTITYYASDECCPSGYTVGTKVAIADYDTSGQRTDITYFDAQGYEITNPTNYASISVDSNTGYTKESVDTTTDVLVSRDYYDKTTWKIIGSDTYDENGNAITLFNDADEKYTAEELAEQIFEKTQSVKTQDLEVRKMELALEQAKETVGSGEIVAKVAGTVKKVQDKDNINYNSSFMTITGTDQYYISGSIGEFYLDSVNVGDVCSITSWESGNMAEATISEIGDYPTDQNGYSAGNSNSSYYEFKASFDIDSGIELGAAVDISISSEEENGGFYIYQALVRKDKTGSYVMRMTEDETLEKVYVTVGKSLWGSYIEITSGNLTMDDYLAFPYGNGAVEGRKCEIVDSFESY